MLNKALRLVRIFHDQSQGKLAKRLGISSSYLSEVESGSKNATIELLSKYADVFNIPPSSLLLFSERLESDDFSEKVRVTVAGKIVRMLEWLATKEESDNAQRLSKKR